MVSTARFYQGTATVKVDSESKIDLHVPAEPIFSPEFIWEVGEGKITLKFSSSKEESVCLTAQLVLITSEAVIAEPSVEVTEEEIVVLSPRRRAEN